MAERDLPEGTANDEPLSLEEGTNAISELIGDPETDLDDEDQDQEADSDDAEDEGDEPDDDADEDDADADEDIEDDEDEDDSQENYEGGKFAADTANVTLDDGTVISVAELKRNNLFQRDYSKKTMEHAEAVKAFDEQSERVNHFAQQLQQQRDFLISAQQQLLPQAPDPSMMQDDPIGYMQQKDVYDRAMGAINQLHQQHQQTAHELQQQNQGNVKKAKAERLQGILEEFPDLADPEKRKSFDADVSDVFIPTYGFTLQELSEGASARDIRVMRDAIAYRKLMANKPKAKAKVEGKPQLLKSGKRTSTNRKISRGKKQRADRLRQTGSFKDGVAALMDLDL